MRSALLIARPIPALRSAWWRQALRHVAEWRQRVRDRSALLALNEHELRDIGLRRFDALREAEKPFWRG